MELRDDPTPHSLRPFRLSSIGIVAREGSQVVARDAHRVRVLAPQTLDQLFDQFEVLQLERAHVLLPELVGVARSFVQLAGLQLLHVQIEGGQHVVVRVQHVQHDLQGLADVAVLEHALVEQIELPNRAAGDEILDQFGDFDEVLHDADDHADDLLAVVRVQTLREPLHHVQMLLAEERQRVGQEGDHPDAQQQLVHELHRVGDAEVEQSAQSTHQTPFSPLHRKQIRLHRRDSVRLVAQIHLQREQPSAPTARPEITSRLSISSMDFCETAEKEDRTYERNVERSCDCGLEGSTGSSESDTEQRNPERRTVRRRVDSVRSLGSDDTGVCKLSSSSIFSFRIVHRADIFDAERILALFLLS